MYELLNGETLLKFIKFGAVGISGLFVDFGVTFLCKEILKIPKYLSNAIGFTMAASTNYVLNRIWTFQSHDPGIAVEFSKFFIVSLIGLGINTLVLWLLVSKFKMNFYLSKLFAIAVVMIWNFLANLLYTFT
ncbi:MAG: GtrA family protein [Bacteroidales bacterium]|nr:GtrA family protein [Bacteroidales bacterium]